MGLSRLFGLFGLFGLSGCLTNRIVSIPVLGFGPMCGRFAQTATPEAIAQQFDVHSFPLLKLRYNIAPSQSVAAIRIDPETTTRRLVLLRWGLIPSWAKDPKIGFQCINAKVETVAEKPSFRAAFRKRRCLVVATGFYEWQVQAR